jgi:hypothetical protein
MGTGLDHSCWASQIEAYQEFFDASLLTTGEQGKQRVLKVPDNRLLAEDTTALMDGLGIKKAHVSAFLSQSSS